MRSFALVSFFLILCAGMPAWSATTYTVTDGGDSGPGTLRQAIADAADGDTIKFDGSVTTVTLTSAELDVAKSLTITGAASPYTVIQRSGSTAFRLFRVGPGTSSSNLAGIVLKNLDMENGSISGNAGGAIYVDEHTNLLVDHCTMNGNHADTSGGAVNVTATSFLNLISCTESNNTAGTWGGAISIPYGGSVNITGSTFVGNSSTEGGAIEGQSWPNDNDNLPGNVNLNVSNSTFTGNADSQYASAILLIRAGDRSSSDNLPVNATATLDHVTIAENTGPHSVYTYNYSGNGTLALTANGSIFFEGIATLTGPGISGSYNLISDGFSMGGAGNIANTDAQLGPLQDNGGPTQTMLPLYTGPGVDAQPAAACDLTTDQRGQPRPQNRACDMGATELDRIFADGFE